MKRQVYLNLLLCLAFLLFGLLKEVNIAVESKTIGVIFPPFFVSVILFSGWAKILKQKSLSSHSLSEKENEYEWFGIACANRRYFFFSDSLHDNRKTMESTKREFQRR